MGWNDVELSTAQTIARIEGEVNSLLDPTDKIALAKKILGRQLENLLSTRGYRVNEAGGENLLELVANPAVFDLASDYLTLHLVYTDLSISMGRESYQGKADFYHRQYESHFATAARAIQLDTDLDGRADVYRSNLFSVGKITR